MNDGENTASCPKCGFSLSRVWGEFRVWDEAVCVSCNYRQELDVSTGRAPDGRVFIIRKEVKP